MERGINICKCLFVLPLDVAKGLSEARAFHGLSQFAFMSCGSIVDLTTKHPSCNTAVRNIGQFCQLDFVLKTNVARLAATREEREEEGEYTALMLTYS